MSSSGVKQFYGAILIVALCVIGFVSPGAAQNMFAPVVTVNDDVVTGYEIKQRQQFLRLLNAPGTSDEEVLNALIEDRLKMQAARSVGLEATEEGLEEGMSEFAGRANLTKEKFITALGQRGIDAETFRDFVNVGITWRELIRSRFGSRVQISQAEIDRALASSGGGGGARVLLSEIIMPAPPEQLATVQARADRISTITSIPAFAAEARRYSATGTRGRGGRLDWMPITNLPPAIRGQVLALSPGQVTAPIAIPNAIALFQLRAIEETEADSTEYSAIDYAAYYIPGGKTPAALQTAATVASRVDTCDDLYGVAHGQPEEVLDRGSLAPSEIPQDIAIELAKLDEGEVSTELTRSNGQTLVLLMLCGRTAAINENATPEDVASSLRQRQLNAYSDSYLEQLRADALIIER